MVDAPKFTLKLDYEIDALCTEVVDGDTAWFAFCHPMTDVYPYQHRCRLARIQAPELNKPGGIDAGNLLNRFIGGKKVKILILQEEKYGRPLVEVTYRKKNINNRMLGSGLAVPY